MADLDHITSKEAADRLGYTVQHVRRLIRQGQIEGVKLGRDWVVREESVDQYVARKQNARLPLAEGA